MYIELLLSTCNMLIPREYFISRCFTLGCYLDTGGHAVKTLLKPSKI